MSKYTKVNKDKIETGEEMVKCVSVNRLLASEEAKDIMQTIQIKKQPKGTILVKEGDLVKDCFYLIKGCVRQYQIINGLEKTTDFYMDGQGISSFNSAAKGIPSNHYIGCLEECKLAVISVATELEPYKKYPNFESLSRTGMEDQLGKYQEMMAKFITLKPEERYLDILDNSP